MTTREIFAKERQRQIEEEGWTDERDDQYRHRQLVKAAYAYIEAADDGSETQPLIWPWSPEWWKPSTPERNLEKAGALFLAEADRIRRGAWDTWLYDLSFIIGLLGDLEHRYEQLVRIRREAGDP